MALFYTCAPWRDGWPALHAELQRADPLSAAKIHPNDAQRIQRALEIVRSGGASRSEHWQTERVPVWQGRVLKLVLQPTERETLRSNIALRFEQMMAAGLLDEVRSLYQREDLHLNLPSIRSVGYRQLWQHLDGELSVAEAVERAIIASRQYAKRQLTWLRREDDLRVLPEGVQQQQAQALRELDEFLANPAA